MSSSIPASTVSQVDDITTSRTRLGLISRPGSRGEIHGRELRKHGGLAFFSVLDYVSRADDAHRASGSAVWDHFQERLHQAVTRVMASPSTATPAGRASAFRGLLQNVHFILERTLGASDPYRPVLSRPWWIHAFDWGAGNPDAV